MESRNRNIKLVTTKEITDSLVSEPPNYHTRNFSDNLLAIEMKKNTNTHEEASLFRFINIENE